MLSLSSELDLNLACKGARDFALHFQNIANITVVTAGPDVSLVARLNQPSGHPNALPVTAHATFQEIIHIQFSSNLPGIFVAGFVQRSRCPRDYTQPLRIQTTQLCDHFFGHTVSKERLLRVVSKVLKWKDGKHHPACGRARSENAPRADQDREDSASDYGDSGHVGNA